MKTEAAKLSPLSSIAVGRLVAGAAVVVAIAIVALIATPSGVWRHPANDGVYKGFDPNLIFVSAKGPSTNPGDVVVSPNSLTIATAADSQPTVHLVTTPLSFSAAFDVTVMAETPDSVPLRIALWSPEASAGYYLVFDPAGNVIRTETVTGGESLQDLVGGTVKTGTTLGTFSLGQTYHVVADVDHVNSKMSFTVDSSKSDVLLAAQAPEIVNAFRPTLTLSASAVDGASQVVIRNYVVRIPSQPSSSAEETVKIDDPLARLLVLVLLAASLALCLFVVVRRLAAQRGRRRVMPALWVKLRVRVVLLLLGAAAIYVLANLSLFGVASPHFDVLAAKVWSYVAYKYGLGDLYYRTILVPAAGAWQGVPMHEATFPYGITKAYLYLVAGWVYHLLPGSATINTFSLEVLLKAMNVLFGFADAILVYLIVKRLTSERTALTAAILFVANPALVLVMSVWGSTETVSLFFILGSIWLAEEQKPLGAWLMLALGAFTRPQMFVFAFLLGLVYLYKFGARRNVSALAWTVILCFVAIGPFALAISPSLPVDYVVRTFIYHVGNGQADVTYLGISPANFSIWTIPLLLVSGQHGLSRMWAPSTLPLAGSLTYGQLAAGMSIAFLLIVGAVLLKYRKISIEPGRYLPLVAFAMLGWLVVTPGIISRYMVYVVVAVILCRKAFSTVGYIYAVSVTTAITCMSIYGHLALDFLGYSGSANVMSPTNNAVSQFLFSIFSADWFISLASLSNVALLIVLGIKGWESLRKERPPALAAAAASAE
ncbi:MAG TPA: hypothetical protein VNU19_05055 [Candidatus Acidoferrum sp.]|nr:hypothetical protein [Candidatus Acidoferrum sp.]